MKNSMNSLVALSLASCLIVSTIPSKSFANEALKAEVAAQIQENSTQDRQLVALQQTLAAAEFSRNLGAGLAVSGVALAALGIKFDAFSKIPQGGGLKNGFQFLKIGGARVAVAAGGTGVGGGATLFLKNQDQIAELEKMIDDRRAELARANHTLSGN